MVFIMNKLSIFAMMIDPLTGELSHTKVLNCIAALISSVIVIVMTIQGNGSVELLAVYASIYGIQPLAGKYMAVQSNSISTTQSTQSTTVELNELNK